MNRRQLGSIVAIGATSLLLRGLLAQTPPASTPPPPPSPQSPAEVPSQQPPQQQVPWPIQLGLRVEYVNQAFPVIDRAVLVPDAATYLDELAKWSPAGRWPVLIEDDQLSPMFLRRFAPAQLIRRESVGALPADPAAVRKQIEAIVVRTFGGDPQQHTIAQTFTARGFYPCGIVVASTTDPAWPAAVALAAGHGQAIVWLDGPSPKPNHVTSAEAGEKFLARISQLVAETGYPVAALGDVIDAVTVCRDMAGRVNVGTKAQSNMMAMTDLLGRGADQTRWALGGWIFGDETRTAYMAMCALFLPRSRVCLYNTYGTTDAWEAYGVKEAAPFLESTGYEVNAFDGDAATARSWVSTLLPGGVTADVFAMNSKGNADFFDMNKGQLHPDDVPILNTPAAVHLIHSWSLLDLANSATVGGRWLTRGVYAYVGSVDEPGLGAFLPPIELSKRWASFVPFLIATRRWESPPWKLNTIGDPLMLCRPPANPPVKPRVNQPAEYGVDVSEQVKDLMRTAKDDATGRTFGEAIRALELLGKDDIAAQLWRAARAAGKTGFAARPALGPLFRLKKVDEFMLAWDDLPVRDPIAADMLWHLIGPRLSSTTATIDDNTLRALENNIRRPQSYLDFEKIAPILTAAYGQAHTRGVLQRELDAAKNPEIRTKLQDTMKRH